jgi:hypothetical protein
VADLLPEVDVDINLRSPIATVIGGVGAAIGGIGNAIGGATKLVGNTIETIGNIAKAGSAAGGDAPDRTVNESNLGLVAAAAQQSVKGKGGSGTLPARKTATKQKPSQNLSTEKLLSIAVKHLSSIDASLKAQMDYNVQATREEAKQEKENDIEGKNNVFTRFADRMKMKASNAAGAAKEKGMGFAQTAAMIAAAALVMKLSTLKPETIERLKKTIDEFQEKYKWLFEDVLPFLSGAIAGASVGRLGGPWGMLIGAIAGGLLSWGIGEIIRNNRDKEEIDRSIATPYLPQGDPEKNLKPLTDEEKALLEDFRKAITEARRPIGGKAGQELAGGAAQEVERLRPKVRALLKSRRPDLNDAELDQMVSDADILAINDAVKKGIAAPNQENKIPAAYYDVPYNEGKDLKPPKPLSQMTVDEVLVYQKQLFDVTKKKSKDNKGHTPAGAFQITAATIADAKKNGIVKGNELFDAGTQDRIAADLFEKRKSGNLKETWAALPNSEEGYYKNFTFDQMKKEIAERELGKTPATPMANAVGNTLTALGNARETFVNALAEQNKNLTPRDPNLTQQMAVDQKANEIRQQAVALENSMRGDAKKEEDRKNAAAQMTPGAKLAKANQGKMEALDPNYKTDSNNIISKYFVYFGLAA